MGNQVRSIRAIIQNEIKTYCAANDMTTVTKCLMTEKLPGELRKKCRTIFPLRWVLINKVKVVKKPAFDQARLLALHSVGGTAGAVPVAKNNREENLLVADAE